jgi:hydrogenase maturation protein HypF
MAVAWLHRLYGRELLDLDLPLFDAVSRDRVRRLVRAIESGFGWPLTSSCGRLFDAVAALAGLRLETSFEGQAAMELEALAEKCEGSPAAESVPTVDEVVRDVVDGIRRGRDLSSIAAAFHHGLAGALSGAAAAIAKGSRLSKVALGGGSFQNRILLSRVASRLEAEGLQVLAPGEVPANDGGLALGQAAVASATMRQAAGSRRSAVRVITV